MAYRNCHRCLLFLLPFLLLFGTGCQEDVSTTTLFSPDYPDTPGSGDRGALQDAIGIDDSALHQSLEAIWKNTDGVLMQIFSQTIDCQAGGVFTARPVGWPEGYDVVLTVDPGTVPLNHGNLVEFVMELPVSGPAGDARSVPYEFHPDGIRFNQPVHITIAWPEWAGTEPASGMDLWYLELEYYDGSEHYRVLDRKASEAAPAMALSGKALQAPLGHFSIDHFSRWNVADGGSNPDGDDKTLLPTLANTVEGDCCWTDGAIDPNRISRARF